MEHRLKREFYERYTPTVARGLLGCTLVRVLDGRVLAGRIVEVEAYRGADDPASHAYRGRTNRNAVMFGEAGHAYVYFIFGFHFCLNITTEGRESPAAVLIRALQPTKGIEDMLARRKVGRTVDLTNGPGKLTKVMSIDRELNGEDITTSERLYVLGGAIPPRVVTSGRIGVSTGVERSWRYFVPENPFVSRGRPSNALTDIAHGKT